MNTCITPGQDTSLKYRLLGFPLNLKKRIGEVKENFGELWAQFLWTLEYKD